MTKPNEDLLAIAGDRRLHVGGQQVKPGWTILNALPGPGVDIVGDARDLSTLGDASYDAIYASHVLEHVSYNEELATVLKGFARVLRPGGKLFVSVPDLEALCRLFISPELPINEKFHVMRMMFGGQLDRFDFHYVGFNAALLANVLTQYGFTPVYRVPGFGFFEDTSSLVFRGVPVSLNVVATRGAG
jgi:predicted SAM-dependent methyltransferase